MTDVDERLAALWAMDEAPADDPTFVVSVMEAVARRRLRARLVWSGVLATASSAGLWAVAPMVEAALGAASGGLAPNVIGAAAASVLTVWLIWDASPGGRAV